MAYLAIRGSGAVNGVSRLHGEVSRHLFQPLFPRWPTTEVPVGHVTNGVHMPSWDSARPDALWTQAAGKRRWLGTMETLEQGILRCLRCTISGTVAMHRGGSLVEYARERLVARISLSSGAPPTRPRRRDRCSIPTR